MSLLGLAESDLDSVYGTKNKSLTSSSYKSADGPSNKKPEINNFKLFINSKQIVKPQLSITSNLQLEKRATKNNLYNSTIQSQDCSNNKLSARTAHKQEEENNSEFTSLNPSPRYCSQLSVKSNENSKSKSKERQNAENQRKISKAKSNEFSTPEVKQLNNQCYASNTKSLLLLKKGKGSSPEAERNPYQSTISFENKIKDKAKVVFDLKNPLREKKGSVLFNLSSENSRSKNSSTMKKKA